MTERRRPAAAGRVLAAGLSAAATLSMTGLFALEAAADDTGPATTLASPTTASPETLRRVVVVVRRVHLADPGAASLQGTTGPARAVPAPTQPQSQTRTQGS